ncbi:MAG: rod shape-determining protein MreC [Betaproteobacteria bacterium]
MDHAPPPLFTQGVPARARLAFFALLAVALMIVDARVRALDTMRLGVGVLLYPLQQAVLLPVRAAEAVGDYFASATALGRENEQLRRSLAEQAQAVQQARQLQAENDRLRALLAASERAAVPGMLAQVVYESPDRFSRKLVVDRGATQGVRPGQPVIDDRGVVGQVTRSFPLTAEVTLLTDKEQSIPVQIVRNGLRGVAFGGAEPGTLELRFMATNADLVAGDEALTSGLDGVYPAGLAVARVERVERVGGEQFARVVMRPAAGVDAHTHLLVLQVEPAAVAPPPAAEPARGRDARRRP